MVLEFVQEPKRIRGQKMLDRLAKDQPLAIPLGRGLIEGAAPAALLRFSGGCRWGGLPRLDRPPVISVLFVVQVPDASDVRMMPIFLCPIDCFALSLEGSESVISVILNHIVVNRITFWSAFWSWFDIDGRHLLLSSC
jgi:hypothetical protein